MFYQDATIDELNQFFRDFDFLYVENSDDILKNGKYLDSIDHTRALVNIYEYENELYLQIKVGAFSLIYKDARSTKNIEPLLLFLFIGSVFVLLLLMFLILKWLYPLKILHKNIKKFADGDLNVSSKSSSKDEIGVVSNEFDRAVRQIESLTKSRKLFLRNIMHELKTPITKGKITLELIESGKQKERLKSVFLKLEHLISEFAKLERFESKSFKIDKRYENLKELIELSIDALMLENISEIIVLKCKSDISIEVDRDYFILALKNLIDNGLKYKIDSTPVEVIYKSGAIIISNSGKELDGGLGNYLKPFYRTPSKDGLGLGLYIANSIIEEHSYILEYKREGLKNHFIIRLN